MINLTVVIDNDEALKKLRELQNVAKTTTSSVVKDSERMDASFQQFKDTLMSLTAGVSFAALAKQIVNVRGEVQQLEVAFETMLGSKEKASRLLAESIDLAAKTPFGLQEVSNASKQLLAYGSTAEEVTGEIKMLGNIAAGLSIPLGDLIYLYGTTRTQGRMFTMDLRQFMGRGIPLAEELAKQFGVTKDKVGELVTAGKVGFDDMAKALQAMSSEGGEFYNLMDKQSKTITGQISNLQDSIYQMFNKIGKSSEGVISDMISGASWVVEHYQDILKALLPLIAAYGTYKTALIAFAAIQKAVMLGKNIAMFYGLAKAITSAKDAMLLLNMATNANPLGILLSVLAAISVAVWQFSKGTEDAARQMGALEKAAYDEYIEVNRLAGRLEDANLGEKDRNDILNKLKQINPDIVKGISDEANMTDILTANLKKYNDEKVREMQLKAITDKQNDALKVRAEAELKRGEATLNASNAVSDIRAMMAAGTLQIESFSRGDFRKILDAEEKQIKQQFEAQILAILNSSADDITKLSQIKGLEVLTNPAGQGGYRRSTLKGFEGISNIKTLIDDYTKADAAFSEADKAVEKLTEENKALAEVLGITDKATKESAEAVKTYAQAYADARAEYLRTTNALAKAESDRVVGRSTMSEKDYITLKEEAEAAKKEYQKLGGITSTKAQSEEEKKAKEAAELAVKLQNEVDKAAVDAMEEGTMKKIAQIQMDYRMRKQEIEKEQADLIAKQEKPLTAEQQTSFDALHAENERVKAKAIEKTFADEMAVRDEYLIQYGNQRERELAIKRKYDKLIAEAGTNVWEVVILAKQRDEELSADEKAWNEYLIKYGTFQERRKAITDKYTQDIANAKNDAERKTLEAERDALLAEYSVQASAWAQELVDMSTTRLTKMLKDLQVELEAKEAAYDALDSSDSASAEEYRNIINELRAKIAFLLEELGKAKRQTQSGDWAGAAEVFHSIASAANETADGLEGMNDGLAEGLKAFGQLAGAAGSLVSAISMVVAASGALNMALGIIGLIAAAINAVLSVVSLFKDNYGVEETMRQFEELNKEIERTRELARIDSWKGTIFGEDAFGNFTNNLEVLRDASQALEESQMAIMGRHKFGRGFDSIEKAIGSMQVKTRDRSGFAEAFGAKDEYANLGDLMPSLFGEDGKITLKGLQELRDSDVWDKISEENRNLIDDMIADWELYEEALDATNEYMSDIFGDLGASITNSLVDAFKNGTDAAIAMGDAVSNVVEQIATDMAHAAFIQPLLTQAQEGINALNQQKMDGTLTDEEYMRQLMEITSGLMGDAEAAGEDMNAFLEYLRQQAKEMGIDVFESDSAKNSTYAKGFQTMSQETGSELNGRFTDIQGQTHRIAEAVEFCRGLQAQQAQHLQSVSSTLASIHNDTSLIAQHTKALGEIRDDISVMRRAMDNGII